MRQDAKDAVAALEPYGGGRGAGLWRLHRLNIIDKHQTIFTAASRISAIDAVRHWARTIPQLKPLADHGYVLIPKLEDVVPLQVGSLVFESLIREPDENLQFAFDVAFFEPDAVYGEPVLEVVKNFADVVQTILNDFAPLL